MTVLPMNNLQLLLFQTINPTTSKHATQQLASLEKDPTFTLNLLNLINDANDSNLQLTGAIYLKNFMKKYYHEENIIPNETKNLVKSNIVELCLKLNQQVQFQLYDVVNIIADCDFPDQWGDLIPALVNKFEMNSPSRANVSALQIVHGVISRWKGEYKSDHLFSQLKLVLSQFCVPYLELFKRTDMALDQLLLDPNQHKEKLSLVLETILLLLNIHLDFIGHDLPEFFEDNASTFFQLFLKYLKLDLKLNTENHDEPGFNEKIKTCICEIVDVFAKRYENEFEMLPTFVENIWNLLVTTGLESKNDLVCAAVNYFDIKLFLSWLAKQLDF
ncbi:importin-alpha export receptor [Clydaea vesicula]|uniref:Importin-alpha export receptor n=1 Tax=Clydaea vesicula TaxID=447962 RepID=A0AAD5TW61_9FUNG|nr:importin-alpha export receptor [Clydaea vesicula]